LFDAETMEALTDEERKYGIYTGARCPPRKRADIIMLLAEGRAIDGIARLVHVHRQTVLNVANEFAVEIADYERRMPAKLKRTKWNLVERIEREVDSIPRQALGLTLKIVSDIEAMDSGRAIARVDHVHRIDLFSDFQQFVQELEDCSAMDGKNGADIHLAGGKKAPLSALGANLDAVGANLAPIDVEAGQDPLGCPASDWKSDVSGLPAQQNQTNTPTLPTDSLADSTDPPTPATPATPATTVAAEPDREGGGSRAGAPTNPTKDNGSQKFLGNGL
jgi:hypothetical protein